MATKAEPSTGELSKGAQWIISQIDAMQRAYMESLMAAVTILQFQNRAKQLGQGQVETPIGMIKRQDNAWAKYEMIKRHVEWYMKQNAYYASSPNHPAVIMPTPQPPVLPEVTQTTPSVTIPKASPIPLSTASMLAYSGENTALPSTGAVSALDQLMPSSDASTSNNPFGLDMGSNDGNNTIDLSALGIGELTSLINSTDNFFPSNGDGMANQSGAGDISMFDSSLAGNMGQGFTPNTQADAEKIIASLGSLNSSANRQAGSNEGLAPQNGQMSSTTDVDALLASLNSSSTAQDGFSGLGGNNNMFGGGAAATGGGAAGGDQMAGQQEFNFDFGLGDGSTGDMDLSELVGLFNVPSGQDSGAATRIATPNPPAGPGQQQQQQPKVATDDNQSASTAAQSLEQQSQPNQKQQSTQPQSNQPVQPDQQAQQQQQQQQQQPTQQSQSTENQQTMPQAAADSSQQLSQKVEQAAQEPQQPSADAQSAQQQPAQTQPPSVPDAFAGNGQFDISNLDLSNMTGLEGFTSMQGQGDGGMAANNQADNGMNGSAGGGGFDSMGGIDMDDFNFTDNGTLNVDGDEFESMLAEFE